MAWNKILFNAQNIEKETTKAVLIKMPKKSSFSKYSFWHPAKLVREEGGKGFHCSFSFTDEWEFTLKSKTSSQIINADAMFAAFEVVNEQVSAYHGK